MYVPPTPSQRGILTTNHKSPRNVTHTHIGMPHIRCGLGSVTHRKVWPQRGLTPPHILTWSSGSSTALSAHALNIDGLGLSDPKLLSLLLTIFGVRCSHSGIKNQHARAHRVRSCWPGKGRRATEDRWLREGTPVIKAAPLLSATAGKISQVAEQVQVA